MSISERQQVPPSLTFASPLAKSNFNSGSEVAAISLLPTSTHAFKQKFS